MNNLEPMTQTRLYGLNNYFLEFVRLFQLEIYPNKILLSGQKGIGKSTLAYHFINYVLTENEPFKYDLKNLEINIENRDFKTLLNRSNTNLSIIDVKSDKKSIDINQIRGLITNLNKSSFNNKPRFVLLDNIELLNINSINALLKILEEPNDNIYFILIHNNKKVLPTLISRCINYKISLSNKQCLEITNLLLGVNFENLVNKDIINYYSSPGDIYNLVKFASQYNYDLSKLYLKDLLKLLIKDNQYKKDLFVRYMMYSFLEFYLRKLNESFSTRINDKYSYFLRKISDTKSYNLDEEILFSEFNEEVLNG